MQPSPISSQQKRRVPSSMSPAALLQGRTRKPDVQKLESFEALGFVWNVGIWMKIKTKYQSQVKISIGWKPPWAVGAVDVWIYVVSNNIRYYLNLYIYDICPVYIYIIKKQNLFQTLQWHLQPLPTQKSAPTRKCILRHATRKPGDGYHLDGYRRWNCRHLWQDGWHRCGGTCGSRTGPRFKRDSCWLRRNTPL